MQNKERLSATVDAELLDVARRAVADGRARSVSAWVEEALRRHAEHEAGLEALDRWYEQVEAEDGPFTPEELREAERWMQENAIRVRRRRPDAA